MAQKRTKVEVVGDPEAFAEVARKVAALDTSRLLRDYTRAAGLAKVLTKNASFVRAIEEATRISDLLAPSALDAARLASEAIGSSAFQEVRRSAELLASSPVMAETLKNVSAAVAASTFPSLQNLDLLRSYATSLPGATVAVETFAAEQAEVEERENWFVRLSPAKRQALAVGLLAMLHELCDLLARALDDDRIAYAGNVLAMISVALLLYFVLIEEEP